MKTVMLEKRRCHRFKIELPAWFKSSAADEEFSIGTTVDVSATGMCLVSKAKLKLNQDLLLQVKLPSEEILFIKGKIVWVKDDFRGIIPEYRVGFRIETSNLDELKFVRFCAMKMLEFYRANVNPYHPENRTEKI